jgi:hypothetical protein
LFASSISASQASLIQYVHISGGLVLHQKRVSLFMGEVLDARVNSPAPFSRISSNLDLENEGNMFFYETSATKPIFTLQHNPKK